MNLQRIKFIIVCILALALILVLALSFGLKRRDKTPKDENVPDDKKNEEKAAEDVISELENIDAIIAELRVLHPEFNDSEVGFYRDTAKHSLNVIVPCLEREDKNECIASIAFLRQNSDVCGEIADLKHAEECKKEIMQATIEERVKKCLLSDENGYLNCLGQIFKTYGRAEDCAVIGSQSARSACEDIVIYLSAFKERDLNLCSRIKDGKISHFCFDNKMIKDTDNDGLSDGLEADVYHTDPNRSDTDSDGYSDGDEVKNGYDPLGPGKLQ